jgi:hypothetical protein
MEPVTEPMVDTPQEPAAAAPPQDDRVQVQERLRAERAKLSAELDAERKARADLEARMAKAEEDKRLADLARMQPDERIQAQLSALEAQVRTEREARAAERAASDARFRAAELSAYRERVLRSQPNIPASMTPWVTGSSEDQIDQSMAEVSAMFQDLQRQFSHPVRPAEAVAAPPPNPAYPQVPQTQVSGYPTPVNPLPVTEDAGNVGMDIKSMTSEQAVRGGMYSGEMRAAMHKIIQQQQYQGNMGSAPRNWQQSPPAIVGYTQQPGGVLQPQGSPIGTAVPARIQQPVQPQAPARAMAAPQAQDIRAAAQAAIARTHQGANPMLGDNVGASEALSNARAYASARGIASSNDAFAARFGNSPPA